jgi:hypothetical protein
MAFSRYYKTLLTFCKWQAFTMAVVTALLCGLAIVDVAFRREWGMGIQSIAVGFVFSAVSYGLFRLFSFLLKKLTTEE